MIKNILVSCAAGVVIALVVRVLAGDVPMSARLAIAVLGGVIACGVAYRNGQRHTRRGRR